MKEQKTGADRVRRRREKLRAAGLRPLQLWVSDTRAPGFAAECARQVELIRSAEKCHAPEDDATWFDASDKTGWTE